MHIDITAFINMQQVRSNRELLHETSVRSTGGEGGSPLAARTEISLLVNEYTGSQKHCK